MRKLCILAGFGTLALTALGGLAISSSPGEAVASTQGEHRAIWDSRFDVDILVNGRRLDEYQARGRNYVEALEGAEYEVVVRNPLPSRVAVALSVDGLNTIDARRSSAWEASKWVIEPYGSITISGWQMSSQRARRFYFTNERDSYGAKLGQSANLGVISAVFFRERRPVVEPITPPPHPYPSSRDEDLRQERSEAPSTGSADSGSSRSKGALSRAPDDEYAATGIGRSVHNDVRWVNMDLDSRPAGEVFIRYEYYPALVRLGILPRPYYRPDPLQRREGARGFEDRRFSPEP